MTRSGAQPKAVSILIPSYNKQRFIEETLQSVYAQTFSDYELIVVDDGSTDASPELLERHAAAGRLRLIRQANQGASAARQRALEASSGRFIQYLDADDLLLPDALAARVTALEDCGADVAYADFQRLRQRGAAFARAEIVARDLEDVHSDPEIACFTSFWYPPAALLYGRDIVDRIGPWNATLPVIQDARYLLDAALAGARFVRVRGVGALYRDDTADSLSRGGRAAFARDVFTNAEQVRGIWQARGPLGAEHLRALGESYEFVARETFRQDARTFQTCVDRLRELGRARPASWPVVAASLRSVVGQQAALGLLRLLGRPAP